MATIYLAALYARREELLRYAADLREAGHEVTSRWLTGNAEGNLRPREAGLLAQERVEDIGRAEVVISFTEAPSGASRGARHVEFGVGWAWAKIMVVVGPSENLFHLLTSVRVFPDWGLCLANLDALIEARRQLFRPLDEVMADA